MVIGIEFIKEIEYSRITELYVMNSIIITIRFDNGQQAILVTVQVDYLRPTFFFLIYVRVPLFSFSCKNIMFPICIRGETNSQLLGKF